MPPPSRESVVRALAVGGAAIGAVVSARALLRPHERTTDRKLIDWEVVRHVAVERSGQAPRGGLSRDDVEQLSTTYDAMAVNLAPFLGEVCNDVPFALPRFVALDRRGFIDVNIGIVRRLLDPVEKLRATLPDSFATTLGRRMLDRYVGELLGMMSRRVLGQYDPVLSLVTDDGAGAMPEPSLYLIEPNIKALQREQRIPGDALRRWLILHELTHAWQFGQHPWLREYLVDITRSLLLDSLTEDGTRFMRSQEMLQKLPQTVRVQLRAVSRVQAVMSVLEGYSNFVMHRVGKRHLERTEELEAAMHRRREDRTLLERLIMALTGLELKMRQYEIGENFCDAVVDRADLATLNRVWQGAEMMPTMDE
ncbi:MAG: zinc-dependent metalloprotease, partial [Candidatus Dormibacteraeota bacterium]|nr:zinc-dependent metalloprotease [Candidatus Dormibacteraeota bacterium]